MSDQKLKPCPFCGNKRVFIYRKTTEIRVIPNGEQIDFVEKYKVACDMCSGSTEWVYSKDYAIEEWNRRAE